MTCRLILAVLGLGLSGVCASAENQADLPVQIEFYVPSVQKSYGVMVTGADFTGCQVQRYLVKAGPHKIVSKPIGHGQHVLVRLGDGFSVGNQRAEVTPLGCADPPRLVRRVVLGKASPDHSWRVKAVPRLPDVKGHALGKGEG
jgi:hypothetical protein